MRRALVLLFSLIATHAMAFDPAKAPRYPSPDMYKPNVSDLTVNNVLGNVSASVASLFTDAGRSAMFGIKCDGATGTDNTQAINNMVTALTDAQLPPGTCRVKGQISVPVGHVLRGAGNAVTTLAVRPDFNASAGSVVTLAGQGSRLIDIGIDFDQPDTTLRSALNAYPWAIQQTGSGGGWTIDRVRISRATKGLDMRGDQGASKIGLLEMSFFELGVNIDGNRDTLNIQNLRFGTYGFTGNNYQILFDKNATINGGLGVIGLNSGRQDGLIIDSFFSIFYQTALRLYYSPSWNGNNIYSGVTIAVINKMQLDTQGGVLCEWCDLTVAGAYINIGYPNNVALVQQGGSVNFGQLHYSQFTSVLGGTVTYPPTEAALFQINNLRAKSSFTVSGMMAEQGSFDRSLVQVRNANSFFPDPTINLSGLAVFKDPTKAYTQRVFDMQAGIGTITGLSVSALTTGSGTLFNAPSDIPVTVVKAPSPGWTSGINDGFVNFKSNFGYNAGGISVPGVIFSGGTITSANNIFGVNGLYTGAVNAPNKIVDGNGNATVNMFGANGAAAVGKCTLSPALPTDNSATSAATANAYNVMRNCLTTYGLAQ